MGITGWRAEPTSPAPMTQMIPSPCSTQRIRAGSWSVKSVAGEEDIRQQRCQQQHGAGDPERRGAALIPESGVGEEVAAAPTAIVAESHLRVGDAGLPVALHRALAGDGEAKCDDAECRQGGADDDLGGHGIRSRHYTPAWVMDEGRMCVLVTSDGRHGCGRRMSDDSRFGGNDARETSDAMQLGGNDVDPSVRSFNQTAWSCDRGYR